MKHDIAVSNAAAARDAAKAAADQLFDQMMAIALVAFENCRGSFNCDDIEIGCP